MRFSLILLLLSMLSCAVDQVCEPSEQFEINGHRGLRGLYPENSLYGFLKTIEKGYYKLELDLIMTADSQLVLFHDPSIGTDLCEVEAHRPIFDYRYEELEKVICGTTPNSRFPQQERREHPIPLLKDFLDLFESHALSDSLTYIIEIKSPNTYESRERPSSELLINAFLTELQRTGVKDKTVLQSFDPKVLEAFRMVEKDMPILFLLEDLGDVDEALARLTLLPEIVGVDHEDLDADKVADFHRKGISVTAWTVNEAPRIRALRCMGVDDVMSDYHWTKDSIFTE